MGCLGTVVSLLLVGFSVNFWMALVGRCLGGALNGNIGVIQTIVGEVVVNPRHERKSQAVVSKQRSIPKLTSLSSNSESLRRYAVRVEYRHHPGAGHR